MGCHALSYDIISSSGVSWRGGECLIFGRAGRLIIEIMGFS